MSKDIKVGDVYIYANVKTYVVTRVCGKHCDLASSIDDDNNNDMNIDLLCQIKGSYFVRGNKLVYLLYGISS